MIFNETAERKRKSDTAELEKIGLTHVEIDEYFGKEDTGDYSGQLELLRKNRCRLLEEVHNKERFISHIDYFIYQIKTKQQAANAEENKKGDK